jgi:tripartite-type tricarboxylate transporter receptor subunit TctC
MIKKILWWSIAVAGALATAGAMAQAYPTKAIRVIVPSSPGGGTDILARVIAAKLTEAWGQQVVVENRAGAGQMIGIELAAKAAPDGYSLLMAASTLAINPVMYKKVPYDALRDFAPITQAAALPNILVAHPSLPVKNVKELVALAKARPGQLVYASAGHGTSPHLSFELFLYMTGTKMIHIPYKGTGPGAVDTVAGQVQLMMPNLLTALPHVKSGRLRALGVTSAKRAVSVPDVPTIAQAGVPGYEAIQWYGFLAPAGTPREIVAKLNAEIVKILAAPETREKLSSDGAEPVGSTPEQFAAFIKSETEKWGRVVKAAGIQPE